MYLFNFGLESEVNLKFKKAHFLYLVQCATLHSLHSPHSFSRSPNNSTLVFSIVVPTLLPSISPPLPAVVSNPFPTENGSHRRHHLRRSSQPASRRKQKEISGLRLKIPLISSSFSCEKVSIF